MSERILSRKHTELTPELVRHYLNYDPESGILTWRIKYYRAAPGDSTGCSGKDGYLRTMLLGKLYLVHRLAWLHFHGVWPVDQLDHINRCRDDNRLCNLREVTDIGNRRNMSKSRSNTSGYPGVQWYKRDSKWQAKIMHNKKDISLGLFATIEEAIAARKAGELKYWGVNRTD